MGTIIGSIGAWLLSKVMGLASGHIIEKAIDLFNLQQDKSIKKAEIDADVVKQAMAAYVSYEALKTEETKIKLNNKAYWLLIYWFILPLGIYWSFTIAVSIYPFMTIYALPPVFMGWAGDMIKWLFYIGSGVLGIKALMNGK